jgi:hypothetical protein
MSKFPAAAESGWGWTGGRDSIQFDLVFVRDVPVEGVIEAFGVDPAAAKLIPQVAYGPLLTVQCGRRDG